MYLLVDRDEDMFTTRGCVFVGRYLVSGACITRDIGIQQKKDEKRRELEGRLEHARNAEVA